MKVALATGAGHRLGRELALGLGRAGYAVAVHHRSKPDQAHETVRLLKEIGVEAEPFSADFEEKTAPEGLILAVEKRFGRLDALLHAASPWRSNRFESVRPKEWDAVFAVGPRTAFFLAQAAAPLLRNADGSVLFVSDVAAVKAWPNHIPHAAAKAALNALVVNLAVALGPQVRVNGIAPGIVLPPEDLDEDVVLKLIAKTPLKRKVVVKDLVDMAVAILQNRSMTGQVVAVDGGRAIV